MNAFNPMIHAEAAAVILIIALLSSKFKLLDQSEISASIPISYIIYVFGGVRYFIPMLVFYLTSGTATNLGSCRSIRMLWIRVRSGWRNVVANGTANAGS